MGKRKRIALIYTMDKGWIGGTYYILNLICSLKLLNDNEKPVIVLVCKSVEDFEFVKQNTGYEYLDCFMYKKSINFFPRLLNKVTNKLFGVNVINNIALPVKASVLFPVFQPNILSKKYKSIIWIPDFQEKYYPEYFSANELKNRNDAIEKCIEKNLPIIFSSKNAQKDFCKFNEKGNIANTYVLHFAVTLPQLENCNIEEILTKYGVNGPYFFCANQFWQHKNHLTLFKAIKALKDKGINIKVLFSGNTNDYRNKNHFPMLMDFIKENGLEDNIKILGFIDRKEQLCLMQNSEAIIQPSLFEGWSTVVEDAKALKKWVILSDIPLHREQLSENVVFFSPLDSMDLSQKIEAFLESNRAFSDYNYDDNIKDFSETFMKIINKIQ